MRTATFKVIFLCMPLSASLLAADFSSYEATCREIGFKKKTEAFGECVLELAEREQGSKTSQIMSADDQTCQKYGFKPKTQAFAECKFKLDMAKKEGAQAQEKYAREKAEYDRQVAAMQREQEKARAMKQLELGLRMMGGQSPVNAINSVGTGAPIAPSMPSPINQTITTPSGRMINCTTIGNNTNCF